MTGNKRNQPGEESAREVSEEIFGEPLEDNEEKESILTQNEDTVSGLNKDFGNEKEAVSGIQSSLRSAKEKTDTSPGITSDDIDANWEEPNVTEEVSMGENPTPDQDQVDALSRLWGTNYKPEELLDVQKKARELEQRRENDENQSE